MVRRFSILGLGVLAALLAAPAMASDEDAAAPGQARSTSFAPLAADPVIAVRPLDNTRANVSLRQQFAAALAKRSIRVQEMPAPLVLNFETEVDQTIRRMPTMTTATGGNRETDARIDVWSSQPGRARANTHDRGMLRYVLTATLDDENTGRRIWQGEAIYAGAPADEAATMAAMATILVEQLGQTVRQRLFRIE
jgi:hypothetical protein